MRAARQAAALLSALPGYGPANRGNPLGFHLNIGLVPKYGERTITMTRPAATATIQIENERIRVTEWRFAPGTATGWHVHPADYIVVPMSTGELGMETRDGVVVNSLQAGVSYTRVAGSEHNVFNDGASEFVFVEIELK